MIINESQYRNLMARIHETNPEALEIPGADCALIGIVSRCGMTETLCYDFDALVEHFMEANGWGEPEAQEWVETQIAGAYVGEGTPMILERPQY